MMRCAEITGAGHPLKVVSRPRPAVPSGGVLVRTTYAGVCHSDIHFINDHMDLGAGRIFKNRDFLGDSFIGTVPGHEIAGVIEDLGPEVDGKALGLSLGDPVVVYPWIGCQECSTCLSGYGQMCNQNKGGTTDIGQGAIPGGYSSHVPVPHPSMVVKIPDNIPMHVACMLPCSASTAFSALNSLRQNVELARTQRPDRPARLLVIGAGGVGLWCIRLARFVLDKIPLIITVADIDPGKLKVAQEFGADATLTWKVKGDTAEDLAETTRDGTMDAAVDFVGVPRTAEIALGSMSRGGTLVLVGLAGGQLTVSLPVIISNNVSIHGIRVAPLSTLKHVVDLVSKNDITFDQVEMVKLENINDVHSKMKAGQLKGRAIIVHD